ncbi:MAG: hypothetical protein EA417_13805 [Gammaproteobacteria bacterium]|nr:MAG: hypothetical protein EA417_13805 [Gammaproteobacteria bacterium]
MAPKLLTKKEVLAADDRATEIVEVPEWGGAVRVQALDAWQQSKYEQSLFDTRLDERGKVQVTSRREGENVRLAALGIVEEDGKPMFTEAELRTKSAAAVNRCAAAIRRLSGMDTASKEKAAGN